MARPDASFSLQGVVNSPRDADAALTAEAIVAALLTRNDVQEAVKATKDIDHNVFVRLISALHERHPAQCYAYLSAVIAQHPAPDLRAAAAQFLAVNYALTRRDMLALAQHLPAGPFLLDSPEVVSCLKHQLLSRAEFYELYSQLDDLSAGARIDTINLSNISYDLRLSGRVNFCGTILIEAVKEAGVTHSTFTGTFAGYFDAYDIYLESASLADSAAGGAGGGPYDGQPK